MFLKGVNLGGWLVPEKWITPDLFKHYNAVSEPDLYKKSFHHEHNLQEHFAEFINEGDFVYLNTVGINAVRIPISYGVFGDVATIPRTIEFVDFALLTAEKFDMQVLIDLHTAPGSQNGWELGGTQGKFGWHSSRQNIEKTLSVIELLAARYKNVKSLYGIELINEPHSEIPLSILKDYYVLGYKAIRKHCSEDVAVVISDSFRPLKWTDFMNEPEFKNVVLDMHLYQCFSAQDKKLTVLEHFEKTTKKWGSMIAQVQQGKKAICGEWSMALDNQSFLGLTEEEKRLAIRDYGKVQLETFSALSGWFYWTYKMSYNTVWGFRTVNENGMLSYA